MLLTNTFLNTKNRIIEEIHRKLHHHHDHADEKPSKKKHGHGHDDEKPSKKKPDISIKSGESTSSYDPKASASQQQIIPKNKKAFQVKDK